jgi:hypothetical protein
LHLSEGFKELQKNSQNDAVLTSCSRYIPLKLACNQQPYGSGVEAYPNIREEILVSCVMSK